MRFVDVVQGQVCCCIEGASQKQACISMAVDRRGNYAALITQEGEVCPTRLHCPIADCRVLLRVQCGSLHTDLGACMAFGCELAQR